MDKIVNSCNCFPIWATAIITFAATIGLIALFGWLYLGRPLGKKYKYTDPSKVSKLDQRRWNGIFEDLNSVIIILMAAMFASCSVPATLNKSGNYTIATRQGNITTFKEVAGKYTIASDTLKPGSVIPIIVFNKPKKSHAHNHISAVRY